MTKDIYRSLQERLDLYSMGFPKADSGIDIEILKNLFTEEEAGLSLALSHSLEFPKDIAERVKRPEEEIAAKLDDMAEKGLTF